ncbi:TetR/AcrR family transcriptional regulator [Streptomyces dysideae]|uniref:TetR/AcrR family transcriptional regulator n=1 Tax=Streptomyces dysideae TaxID=909626 RepID=UPI001F3B9381|nr:TetR/AcrR family transcriptional regulator [Streptomyces dysideae]
MKPTAEPGRREQNKRRTREALIQAAAGLFHEKGYEDTTVADIASAAGVGERTFFRYFPTKESLLLQETRELIPLLAGEIVARPPAEAPLVALRNAILGLVGRDEVLVFLLAGRQPLPTIPRTHGERFLLFDFEEAVASAFLTRTAANDADLRDPEHRLRASILARAGVGVLRALRLAHTQLPESSRKEIDLFACVRAGFETLLEAAIEGA